MVEWGRAGGRAQTWPPGGARRPRSLRWPARISQFADSKAEQLKTWAIAEVGPGRLLPWLAVAFGTGVALYFAAEREPAWWAAVGLTIVCATSAVLARRRPIGFPITLAAAAMAAGFTTGTLKQLYVAHPVLVFPASNTEIAGFVEVREERERTDRIVIAVHRMEGRRLEQLPERVRLSVRKGTAPPVGTFVELKARLTPPLQPLRPGGYDFARDLYFQQIGASGLVLGQIKTAAPPVPLRPGLRFAAAVQGVRDAIDARIRAAIPGDAGAIASALITGKRDAISAAVNDAMYVSSLAHVLSISGYHMALVAGAVFFAIRALLALFPALATGYSIKKWAALAALIAAAFYLVLSGAEIATRRAFIMVAIVLVGVMLDRQALTMRTLTVAALALLLIAPEALVHPSFQMSFAATLALIAAYERGMPWSIAGADSSLGARIALWGGREIVALVLASLVAGLATTLYAAYHFHRLAPYGVLANLLAMPIVSIWIMPSGLLAIVAMPFGFDGPLWRLMGLGIDWMTTVALWVASLPGAVGRIAAFGVGPLLLGTAGLIVVCLLKTPLRWCGAAPLALAVLLAARTPLPDALIAADGQSYAVRGSDGRLSILRLGSDSFAARDWLASDGDARTPKNEDLRDGFVCDEAGCTARLGNGVLVSVALSAEAFDEDCRRATLVLSPREAPPACAATVIDRRSWRRAGAISVRHVGERFEIQASRPVGTDRPWARGPQAAEATAAPASARPAPRDATPRAIDLEPGD
jgi:competence protein ComEC